MALESSFETQSHILYGNNRCYFEKETKEKQLKKYNDLIHELNKLIKSLK